MCGIAGILKLNGQSVESESIQRMVDMLRHRGPDSAGVHLDGHVGLGHSRLSIIDLEGGHQPMHGSDRSSWISFNGEIFNYLELREELKAKGHHLATHSDTEVILRLYEEYGTDCVHHLNGQWAFAIWDNVRRRLFLSRDRMGVRPLFHSNLGDTFLFASEIKALFTYPGVETALDLEALRQTFTYWFPVAPRTIFRNIFELPPGHSLVVQDGKINVRRYWQLDHSEIDTAADISPAEERRLTEELASLLLDATRIRLRADVPVAAYLSGGLDSSIVSALARNFAGSSLATFSVAFERSGLDESPFQNEVTRALGTNHSRISCTPEDIAEVLPEVIRHAECPILRTAPAPMYLLSKLVHQAGYKVALTGEGADELFGGYDIFKETKIRAFCAAQIKSTSRSLLLKRLYPYVPGLASQSSVYLRAFFHVESGALSDPFFSHLPRWNLASRTHRFFSAAVRDAFSTHSLRGDIEPFLPGTFNGWAPFLRAQFLETAFLLPGYLLSSQGDRMAMAHSVEARYPFLDHRVVEFSARIPPRLKMKVLQEKYILKRALGHLVPKGVLSRPKQPYRAPDAVSLFDPETGNARCSYIDEMFSVEGLNETRIFDASAVQKLVQKAKSGSAAGFVDNAALVGILSTQILMSQIVPEFKEKLHGRRDRARVAAVCD